MPFILDLGSLIEAPSWRPWGAEDEHQARRFQDGATALQVDTQDPTELSRIRKLFTPAREGLRWAGVLHTGPSRSLAPAIVTRCENLLGALGVARFDWFHVSLRARPLPLDDVAAALTHLMTSGRILRGGVAPSDVEDVQRLAGRPGVSSVRLDVSLANRRPWREALAAALDAGLEVVGEGAPYSAAPAPIGSRPPGNLSPAIWAEAQADPGRRALVDAVGEIARRHESTPALVTLAWLLRLGVGALVVRPSAADTTAWWEPVETLRLTAEEVETIDRLQGSTLIATSRPSRG